MMSNDLNPLFRYGIDSGKYYFVIKCFGRKRRSNATDDKYLGERSLHGDLFQAGIIEVLEEGCIYTIPIFVTN